MSVPGTVWLVGMMGAGKSTVGPALASRLECAFVDLDAEIEQAAQASIVAIFEREGEAGFRRRERAAIEAFAAQSLVVALGGGAIAQEGVGDRLRACGSVIYLRARPETLVERLGDCEERPLLRGLSPERRAAHLAELLAARQAAYESADLVVDVDGRDPAAVAEQACAALRAARAS